MPCSACSGILPPLDYYCREVNKIFLVTIQRKKILVVLRLLPIELSSGSEQRVVGAGFKYPRSVVYWRTVKTIFHQFKYSLEINHHKTLKNKFKSPQFQIRL